MKVVILNGSPRMERGATAGLLSYFLEGFEDTEAEVELVHLAKHEIKHCTGCFTCWTSTPGECVIDDDVRDLLPIVNDSDILVLATPVYVDGMTGLLKNFIDRLIPLSKGTVEIVDGHARHPGRYREKAGILSLVSVCGFPEMDNFDPLVEHAKAIAKNMQREYVGAILRPYAWAVPVLLENGMHLQDVIEAVRQSARDLATKGKYNSEQLDIISRELLPKKKVISMINQGFR